MSPPCRLAQRCLAPDVFSLHIGASDYQQFYYVLMAQCRRVQERRAIVFILCIDIGAICQQKLDHVRMPLGSGGAVGAGFFLHATVGIANISISRNSLFAFTLSSLR